MQPEYLAHGKQKIKLRDTCKRGGHEWYVSKWNVKGVHKSATEFYCKYCMLTMDVAEKNFQSMQSLNAQSNLPEN